MSVNKKLKLILMKGHVVALGPINNRAEIILQDIFVGQTVDMIMNPSVISK